MLSVQKTPIGILSLSFFFVKQEKKPGFAANGAARLLLILPADNANDPILIIEGNRHDEHDDDQAVPGL